MDVDKHVWLSGGEDCDVDAQCRTCDRRGEPVAWYAGGGLGNPYDEARVPSAQTIEGFFALICRHVREVHP